MSDNIHATLPAQENNNAPRAFSEALEGILAQRNLYFQIGDPTEYAFAQKVGGWEQWMKITETEEFSPIIGRWREELATKLASEALSRILEAAKGETRDALGANKYIYETLTENKEKKSKVGRPSREAIAKEAIRLFEEEKVKEEAYNRIFKEKF